MPILQGRTQRPREEGRPWSQGTVSMILQELSAKADIIPSPNCRTVTPEI